MSWSTSDRRQRLPANWPHLRRRVLRRDGHICTARDQYGVRCAEPATDVDHIRPGDDHREANLQSLCGWHHRVKSSREGAAAKAAVRRRNDRKFRRTEVHPGLR
ncbi:HNH endonuclease [Streptomyces sp. VNUA116]|nr:HNH endonuclease [Streptomyces sp. VNUA116]WKU46754.1 HNH endonuclease [Streptomyces sp. VNUA116]